MSLPDSLARLPLSELSLSARAYNSLRRAGITTLGQLSSILPEGPESVRNAGRKTWAEIESALKSYLDSRAFAEAARASADVAPVARPGAPDSVGTPASERSVERKAVCVGMQGGLEAVLADGHREWHPASLAEWVEEWLEPLPQRHREVVRRRYGLCDGHRQTLEEVGRQFGHSRERVRQIQARAVKRLVRLGPKTGLVGSLVGHLRDAIEEAGGLASEGELGASLGRMMEVGAVDACGVVRLVLETHDGFCAARRFQAWGVSDSSLALLPRIEKTAVKVLQEERAPLPAEELLRRLKVSSWYRKAVTQVTDQFILACLRVSSRVIRVGHGAYGLQRWDKYCLDDIIVALRRLGRPAHYREITGVVNSGLAAQQQVTARLVHANLTRNPDLFVWVGRRGAYGLKEWGLERPPSYEDALAQILSDAGHPLTLQEVLAELPRLRPYYEEASVPLTLGTNSRFRAFAANTYGLAEWREEDLASEYRARRVLQASTPVARRHAKRAVRESMSTVDSFIARARGAIDEQA